MTTLDHSPTLEQSGNPSSEYQVAKVDPDTTSQALGPKWLRQATAALLHIREIPQCADHSPIHHQLIRGRRRCMTVFWSMHCKTISYCEDAAHFVHLCATHIPLLKVYANPLDRPTVSYLKIGAIYNLYTGCGYAHSLT